MHLRLGVFDGIPPECQPLFHRGGLEGLFRRQILVGRAGRNGMYVGNGLDVVEGGGADLETGHGARMPRYAAQI